ncbi:MAG: extracellular solute-binding protein, partial [Clostridia bacterium]|nr:extracellular solute-binding protein [Clostridia bacterium]
MQKQDKRILRLFCALLTAALLGTVFAACGPASTESVPEDAPSAASEPEASRDENAFRLEQRDFGGTVIKVLTPKSDGFGGCEIAATEINTEPVNDASYNRAKLISEKYGINVEQHFTDNLIEAIRTQTESGLDEFQACTSSIYNLSILAADGVFYDLKHIQKNDYLDLNQPYWDSAVTRDLAIRDCIYYATGDIVVTDDEATWAMFFNKDIMRDANIMADESYDTIYDLVKDQKWTLDKMHEMAKKGTVQVSSGGLVFGTDSQDTWGLLAQCYDSYAFTAGCGEGFIQRDGDGLRITLGDESNLNAYRKVFDMMWDTSCVGIAEISGRASGSKYYYNDESKIFSYGKALFMPSRIGAFQYVTMREANI